MKPARVLALVTDAYGGTGGIAQYNRDFIEALAEHPGIAAITVIPRVVARDTGPIPNGIDNRDEAAGSKAKFVGSALRLAVGRSRPDLIICGHINVLPVAHLASMISGAPIVLLTYGIEVWDRRGLAWRHMVSKVRAIVHISSFTFEKMRAWVAVQDSSAFKIPNAVDLSRFTPGEPRADVLDRLGVSGNPLLITLGRMERAEQAKGFDEMIDIIGELATTFPDLRYCAAGDGNDRERLEGKARSLGVADRAVFPGYVSEDEKVDLYRAAHLFVMPSRLEGFGYVFLEALACGTPVVASAIDGSREAVRDGALGIMVDPRNRKELIAAIRSALESPFVPERSELDYFSKASFVSRCHAMLDEILT